MSLSTGQSVLGTIPQARFPPLTPEQSDEIARTIYVGNVNSEVSELFI